MFEYIEMSMDHYEEACKIWENTPGLGITTGDSKENIQNYLKRNKGMSHVCLNTEKNIIAGTILCGHDGRRGIIYHLAVREEYRNKGIGITLLNLAIGKLKAEGILRVFALVKEDNKSGSKFWLNHGFEIRDLILYSKDI
ncbi:hypothetical protein BH10BAC5_BH10BAC5_09780 [soil metagenome]